MMRVLIVGTDTESLSLMLRVEGFNVLAADSGEEGIELAKIYENDAIVLDMNITDLSGFEVIRQLRTAKVECALICLSKPEPMTELVRALGTGADDYMTKPFAEDELIARIRAVVRRRQGHSTSIIQIDNLALNLDNRTATVDALHVHLTGKEDAILELMALRKGQTVSKESVMTHLYGGRDEPELKIIDVFVCKLRKKLRAFDCDLIDTVWGRGYCLRGRNVPSPSLVPELKDMSSEMGRSGVNRSRMVAQTIELEHSPSLAPSLKDVI